jgi:hypothetical protein
VGHLSPCAADWMESSIFHDAMKNHAARTAGGCVQFCSDSAPTAGLRFVILMIAGGPAVEVSGPQRMMTRSEWDRLQYEYFQRLIDENRGQKRLTASPLAEKAAASLSASPKLIPEEGSSPGFDIV